MSHEINTLESGPDAALLQQPAQHVPIPLSAEDLAIVEEMKRKLIAINGVGLAAPQIGINKQIIVFTITKEQMILRADGHEVVPVTALINPTYTPVDPTVKSYDWEACFSVEAKTGKVPRFNQIHFEGYTPEGKRISGTAFGFTARVMQHEIDHVNGILITNRLTPDCIQGHPNDMMPLRYQEFNDEQKKIVAKMLEERLMKVDKNNKEAILAIHNLQRLIKQVKS